VLLLWSTALATLILPIAAGLLAAAPMPMQTARLEALIAPAATRQHSVSAPLAVVASPPSNPVDIQPRFVQPGPVRLLPIATSLDLGGVTTLLPPAPPPNQTASVVAATDGISVSVSAPLQTFFVTGAVVRQGQFQLPGDEMTLLRAVAAAGGLIPQAGPDIVVIRREGATGPTGATNGPTQRLSYSRRELADTSHDPAIHEGDTIMVPIAELFLVMGEVNKPGRQDWDRATTVANAIAKAGGMTDKASISRSYVRRKNARGGYDQIRITKLDAPVQAGDEIVIMKKLF
jgi:protein involved in polysaccharide export with SLBB domain